jgi:hypothetical protein
MLEPVFIPSASVFSSAFLREKLLSASPKGRGTFVEKRYVPPLSACIIAIKENEQ